MLRKPEDYPPEFIRHCKWYEENIRIVPEDGGRAVPFRLRPAQMDLEYRIWDAWQYEEPVFLLVLKARREGISSMVSARFYRNSRTRQNRRALIMAHDDPATKNILNNMVQFFLQHDPKNPETAKESASALKFEDTGSEFVVYTAGARGRAARSFAAQDIHFSELDFYEDPKVFTSAMQILPNDYPLIVIVESTADGPDGPMQKQWDLAQNGQSVFTPVFYAWHEDPRYVRELSWSDLIKFGPRGYVEANADWLEEAERGWVYDGVGEGARRRGSDEGDRGATSRAGTEKDRTQAETKAGKAPEGESEHPEEVQGKGSGTGGRVPADPGGRGANLGKGPDGRLAGSRTSVSGGVGRKGSGDKDGFIEREKRSRRALKRRHQSTEFLLQAFYDSLDTYERGLVEEFPQITATQLNWLRWVKIAKCENNETVRQREYPSRPEEAFAAVADAVLDTEVVAKWTHLALKDTPAYGHFTLDHSDRYGNTPKVDWIPGTTFGGLNKVMMWDPPEEGESYVIGVDPSAGIPDSKGSDMTNDWTVGCVLRMRDGLQVAEYRAKTDQFVGVDQIEGLAIYYNRAFVGIEANTYGLSYCREMEDRGTVEMYEREIPDRKEPGKTTKKLGWYTDVRTRNMLLDEVRRSIRMNICRVRSQYTLKEFRSLVIAKSPSGVEKIQARSGTHDDGVFGYGIALLMRNRQLPSVTPKELEKQTPEESLIPEWLEDHLHEAAKARKHRNFAPPLKELDHVHGEAALIDGRRSVL